MIPDGSSKELVLWTHEAPSSTADAILNFELLHNYDPQECILEIDARVSNANDSPKLSATNAWRSGRRLVVTPTQITTEIKKKTPNLQLSLHSHLAHAFNVHSRSIVKVSAVPKTSHVADYMVLYFKDQYISRSDMWRAACNLEGQCIYVGKRITFTGGIRADVREIWRAGKKKFSAYVAANTKPVFRSESARYLIFIQMSKEMWEFEEDGELFYNKAIDGFLPELFKKWKTMGAHHLVSIVLFTRVVYTGAVGPFCLPRSSAHLTEREIDQSRSQLDQSYHNDFYKIVVDNVSSNNWESTLTELKRELHGFAKDVILQKMRVKPGQHETSPIGRLTAAMDGNVLEAINLAAHQFNRDYIDRDLLRTGTSMLFVTAGTGVFEVEERLLRLTGESLLGNGIGMDIVCLSRRPMHVVPLFRYRKKGSSGDSIKSDSSMKNPDDYEYILPYICEISYYGESHDASAANSEFQPRMKMHELQMMSKIEVDVRKAAIDYLDESVLFKGHNLLNLTTGMDARMDLYDDLCFAEQNKVKDIYSVLSKDDNQSSTPGEEVIKLLGTSVPLSAEKKNFKSLYELSRATSTIDLPMAKSSCISGNSAVSGGSIESTSSRASFIDTKAASPIRSRSNFSRLMHRLSDKSDNAVSNIVDRSNQVKRFTNPATNMMKLKSKPSISSIVGAVTISSALEQKHKTIITKGFAVPDVAVQKDADESSKLIGAIPIRAKETSPLLLSSPIHTKKLMTSIDIGEAKAQSVSQSLREMPRARRHSSNKSRTSPAIKYKTPRPEAPDASPWHVLANPSYPSKNSSTLNTKAWRWAHVSDRARRTGDMNWESMCAPAALPLTSSTSIDLEELKSSKYSENSYSIYIDSEDQPLSQKELLREMVGQRLVQGYQLANLPVQVGKMKMSRTPLNLSTQHVSLSKGPLGDISETVYLTHAQMEVHCITCDSSGHMIEVTRYVRKRELPKPIGYSSFIWQLAQDDGYDDSVVLFRPISTNHSWNYVDQIICGMETRFTDSVRFWRARLLFIPSEARDKRNPPPISTGSEQFSEEEVRVAGINKICELLQKAMYSTPGDLRTSARNTRNRTATPISVAFTTLDPAAYIAHENQHFSYRDVEMVKSPDLNQRNLISGEMSLYDVSNEMQSTKGIHIKDRLWHWRWYESSWIGSDFVTWITERTEIQSRDEATRFSQSLMDQGLFEHVQKTHRFLDGFYLYRLKPEYSSKTAKTWFGTRKVTPSAAPMRTRASSNVSSSTANSPTLRPQKNKNQFELSKWMRVDVDPHKKSHRPEFVSVHYDRSVQCHRIESLLTYQCIQSRKLFSCAS